jgi:hypothetical protein
MSPTDTCATNPPPLLQEITPDRKLRLLYTIYLLIIVWGGILPWLIPLAFFSSPLHTLAISIPLLLVILCALWWIGAYHRTIRYRCTPSGISWERGVWFRQTGSVPYHRITALDITQGPISRYLGISLLKVQTPGSSAGSASTTELKIEGITEPEVLRECIMMQVQGISSPR